MICPRCGYPVEPRYEKAISSSEFQVVNFATALGDWTCPVDGDEHGAGESYEGPKASTDEITIVDMGITGDELEVIFSVGGRSYRYESEWIDEHAGHERTFAWIASSTQMASVPEVFFGDDEDTQVEVRDWLEDRLEEVRFEYDTRIAKIQEGIIREVLDAQQPFKLEEEA